MQFNDWFQHTAARRRLGNTAAPAGSVRLFQHTAARRRLDLSGIVDITAYIVSTHSRPKAAGSNKFVSSTERSFQHTAARRRLELMFYCQVMQELVSTHSRPKAAGRVRISTKPIFLWFQHTAARRRLADNWDTTAGELEFQHTAARRRLGQMAFNITALEAVSTHSRPKAAGMANEFMRGVTVVSTHSRPKAAGRLKDFIQTAMQSFNTQPPEGGWNLSELLPAKRHKFQHTAARRRLGHHGLAVHAEFGVSTHSRPKAAGSLGRFV